MANKRVSKTEGKLSPIKLALSATILTSTIAFLSTILTLMEPSLKIITPMLENLYQVAGYNISLIGSILGALYVAIDTFILVYIFAWIYNYLLE